MFKRAFYSTMALLLAAPALAKVDAVDGYVRLLPPGSPNTAAFMVLRNDGDKPVKLVAGASPEAGRVELHTHLHENGVMKMRQVESIEIPAKGEAVVRAMADAVRIPVTVKMRRGVRPGDIDPGEVARRFEAAGAALITIHPRAAVEEYSGTADHRISAQVVEAVDIPVVISGDIATATEARDALEMTGAAGVMIGRAGLGNPWVLGAIARGEVDPRPSRGQVIDELEGFSHGIAELIGPDRACHYLRAMAIWALWATHTGWQPIPGAQRAPEAVNAP